MIRQILIYSIIFNLVHMIGCTDFRTLQQPDGTPNLYNLAIGDTVKLETTDDQKLQFEITDITSNSLVGKHVEIPFEKIRSAEKEEFNTLKTTAAVSGGLLATAFAVLLVIAATTL